MLGAVNPKPEECMSVLQVCTSVGEFVWLAVCMNAGAPICIMCLYMCITMDICITYVRCMLACTPVSARFCLCICVRRYTCTCVLIVRNMWTCTCDVCNGIF